MDELRPQLAGRVNGAALVLSAAFVFALACTDAPSPESIATSAVTRGQGGSPYSIDSALALFRAGMEPLSELQDAAPSIDSAVARFRRAVETRDTTTLRSLAMTRREYAYLYYPTSPFSRPPTLQEPGLNWFLHVQHSQKGATRLFDRLGGKALQILDNSCKGPPRAEGGNRLWDDCLQRIISDGDTVVIRLFGGIYERNGRYKIFSYSNDL